MYKIVNHTPDKAHEEKFGNFNEFPPGWREISQKEFSHSMGFTYSPLAIEYRQMIYQKGEDRKTSKAKGYTTGHLSFFHDGTGTAIISDYWAGTVKFFAFGCEHKYKELSRDECVKRGILHHGRCYHVNECTKCTYINSYDSSD